MTRTEYEKRQQYWALKASRMKKKHTPTQTHTQTHTHIHTHTHTHIYTHTNTQLRVSPKVNIIDNATVVYLHGTRYRFCCHTLTGSEYGGFCLDYLNKLQKKIFQKKPNLIAAIDKTKKGYYE